MLEQLEKELLEAYWEAKRINFEPQQLESFARGVEEGLLKAILILRKQPKV